jgi:hypothetical protein
LSDESEVQEVDGKEKAEILAEHYHKTYELTVEMWKQRNWTFLILVGVVAVAAFLTFSPTENVQPVLSKWIGTALKIEEAKAGQSFPFGLIQVVLMVGIFYLMMNLFHRAHNVLFYYGYLGRLEGEIREALKLPEESIFFTREGRAYWKDRNKSSFRKFGLDAVKFIYVALIGVLLAPFLFKRLYDDFGARHWVFWAVELLIALCTLFYFFQYAASSFKLDKSTGLVTIPDNIETVEGALGDYVTEHLAKLTKRLEKNGCTGISASREAIIVGLKPEGVRATISYEVEGVSTARTIYYYESQDGKKVSVARG